MDDPEETTNPFELPEILVQLLIHADRKDYQKLYQSNKELMDSPYLLRLLQTHYRLPFQPSSFYDFVFERDIRDPISRKNLCMTPKRMLIYAIKSNDPALVRSLLQDDFYMCVETFYLAGTIGNPEVIDQLIPLKIELYEVQVILEGLAYSSHNQLFDLYSQSNPDWMDYMMVSSAAAEGGNLSLVIKLYRPEMREEVLRAAATENHQEIIQWVFDQEPETPDDRTVILQGAIVGGNLQLADDYLDAAKDISHLEILTSVARSDDPKVLEWFLSSDLMSDPYDLYGIYTVAVEGKRFHYIGSYQIVKRILENYDELNSVHNFYKKISGKIEKFRDENRFGITGKSKKNRQSPRRKTDEERYYKVIYRLLFNGVYRGLQFRTVLDMIEHEKILDAAGSGHHLALEALGYIYDQEWMIALKRSIKDDNLEFTRWVINRFHPDHKSLKDLVRNVEGCTAEWIRRTYK
ncbi:Hypothetical protein POVR1_LOCUS284 [uncultured virus]|nr:Hypothetical protein POVR1_LOCUS284 [uncultured virus]